jgi:hypothetical protein
VESASTAQEGLLQVVCHAAPTAMNAQVQQAHASLVRRDTSLMVDHVYSVEVARVTMDSRRAHASLRVLMDSKVVIIVILTTPQIVRYA